MHYGTAFIAMALLLAPGFQSTAEPRVGDKSALSQRAVLYEGDPANPKGRRSAGTVVWRTEKMLGPGQASELAIRADVEIPGRDMRMTWSLRPNIDRSLTASHIIDIEFELPNSFSEGGVNKLSGVEMRMEEHGTARPLFGQIRTVGIGHFQMVITEDDFYLRNIKLIRKRGWFAIPMVYMSGRRAILEIEKR